MAKKTPTNIGKLIVILVVGLAVRLLLFRIGTLSLDFNTYVAWSNRLVNFPLKEFYLGWSDYLPGYLYILWFLGKVASLGFSNLLLYKLPAIVADILIGFLIYRIVRPIKSEKAALFATSLFLFNPAVIANSTFWGQIDALTSLFSLMALYFFNLNFLISATFLALGTLVKPQAALTALVILYLFYRHKWSAKKMLLYIIFSALIFTIGFLPFSEGNVFLFIRDRLVATVSQYPYSSVNAFNFWGIFGFWTKDSIFVTIVALAAFVITFLYLLKKKNKQPLFEYFLLAVVYYVGFLFMGRMHERHLLPVFAPLAIATAIMPALVVPYAIASGISVFNLRYSFVWVSQNFTEIFSKGVQKLLSIVNVLNLFLLFKLASLKSFKSRVRFFTTNQKFFAKPKVFLNDFSLPKTKILLGLILLFALSVRLYGLGSPKTEYFDEVYHAFTAKLVLHGDPKAWEWWNPHPEGFAYEWTHPPLAKLMMAGSMYIFGEMSWAWRLPGAILGVLCVYLVYLLASALFADRKLALLAAGIYSLDGLSLVMSRIGMNDIYMLFSVLFAVYLFIKNKNFWSALFLGLAFAAKWSAIWSLPIFGLIFVSQRKKIKLSLLWFVILPPIIYLASYFQMFLTGHDLNVFWGMQKQMWWYHTRLTATHPYSSLWWEWPLMIRPIYLYTSAEVVGFVSRIYAIGNPFVFWSGLLAVIWSLLEVIQRKTKGVALALFAYFVFFVPWAASPRVMFLYHYLPSLPFLAIAIGYFLRRNSKLTSIVLVLCTLSFVYFIPHWTGISVPLWLDKSYYWFSSWR